MENKIHNAGKNRTGNKRRNGKRCFEESKPGQAKTRNRRANMAGKLYDDSMD